MQNTSVLGKGLLFQFSPISQHLFEFLIGYFLFNPREIQGKTMKIRWWLNLCWMQENSKGSKMNVILLHERLSSLFVVWNTRACSLLSLSTSPAGGTQPKTWGLFIRHGVIWRLTPPGWETRRGLTFISDLPQQKKRSQKTSNMHGCTSL